MIAPADLAALHTVCFTLPRPWTADEFTTLCASQGVFVLGDHHAFIMGRVVLDEAELLTLAVAPDARRKGIARGLVGQFEQHAATGGAMRAFLEVAARNAAALALYQTCGYAQAGMRRGYYRAQEDALVLTKALTPSFAQGQL